MAQLTSMVPCAKCRQEIPYPSYLEKQDPNHSLSLSLLCEECKAMKKAMKTIVLFEDGYEVNESFCQMCDMNICEHTKQLEM